MCTREERSTYGKRIEDWLGKRLLVKMKNEREEGERMNRERSKRREISAGIPMNEREEMIERDEERSTN